MTRLLAWEGTDRWRAEVAQVELGGRAMRQRKEDDVMPGQSVGIRVLHHPVAQRHQVGLVLTQQRACVGSGGNGTDFDLWMEQEKTQQLTTGVTGGTGHRNPYSHVA